MMAVNIQPLAPPASRVHLVFAPTILQSVVAD